MDSTAMAIRFDKMRYIKTLREAGQTQESAEAFADALDVAMTEYSTPLATRQDLIEVRYELKQEIANVRTELKQDIAVLNKDLSRLMAQQTWTIIAAVFGIIGIFIASNYFFAR